MVSEREGHYRPYAPTANVQALLHLLRRMNMPPRITRGFLRGIDISENIVPRVLATIRFLGMIQDDGQPTDILRALAGSTEDRYRQLLEQTIRSAYADELQTIDPTKDPQERIHGAFQRYTPRSQHSRQVMLFLGLCREAGIPTVDAPRRRGMRVHGQKRGHKSGGLLRQPQHGDRGFEVSEALDDEKSTSGKFLGITLEDAANLTEQDFREVWKALGTLFLRRAQRIHPGQQDSMLGQTKEPTALELDK
jgi:hypothetical protein